MSVVSLAIPILLEKNGFASRLFPKSANKSLFSMKNCLFSGKLTSKRVKLVTTWSASTCEKSGLTVMSKFILFEIF